MTYLDNNATTSMAPEVVELMGQHMADIYANPSSPYRCARKASGVLRRSREVLADWLGCEPRELILTSGGTESNNAALFAACARRPDRRHIVTTVVEHASVLRPVERLEKQGVRVTRLMVDADGQLDEASLEAALDDDPALVSVMAANNETGILFPLERVAALCADRGVPLHTDAVQAAGKLPLNLGSLPVDYASFSAHKFHGPKGVGLLYVRGGEHIPAFHLGGDQEFGLRAGTENVAGMAGMAKAGELAGAALSDLDGRVRALRDRLEAGLLAAVPGLRVAGAGVARLPNTLAVLVEKIEVEALLALLDMEGICCSSGSACASGSTEPSHVLAGMGLASYAPQGALRFSLSRYSTASEVEQVLDRLPRLVEALLAQGTREARMLLKRERTG